MCSPPQGEVPTQGGWYRAGLKERPECDRVTAPRNPDASWAGMWLPTGATEKCGPASCTSA